MRNERAGFVGLRGVRRCGGTARGAEEMKKIPTVEIDRPTRS